MPQLLLHKSDYDMYDVTNILILILSLPGWTPLDKAPSVSTHDPVLGVAK